MGFLAAVAYHTVGVAVPLVAAHYSRDAALRFRTTSGHLSRFVLSSLRGLDEILQYRCGEDRLKQIDGATDDLCCDEANVKRAAGRSGAATGAIILIFDLLMLFCAAHLCGFRGALVCTPALMSSFGPCVALSALGTTLQSTLAAGNRVLDILDEATANLDSLNEGAILKSLHEARSGKTILLVSHRASTVAADVCYQIESGRIVYENS